MSNKFNTRQQNRAYNMLEDFIEFFKDNKDGYKNLSFENMLLAAADYYVKENETNLAHLIIDSEETESVFLDHEQILACEKAIAEINGNGIRNTTIKVINNGPNVASQLDIKPTAAGYLFELGMKTYKFIINK